MIVPKPCRVVLTLFVFLYLSEITNSQDYVQVLKSDFPSVYTKFERELSGKGSDFIMVIDNSQSMRPYASEVTSSINTFIRSVPASDYVSVILFDSRAVDPADNPGYASDGPLNKATLLNRVSRIAFNGQCTDIGYMINSLKRELTRPGGNKIKFVFVFTDFYDEPCAGTNYPVESIQEWINEFKPDFNTICRNNFLKIYPISLRLGSHNNEHLSYFQQLFPNEDCRPIDNITEPSALTLFFTRLHAEIGRQKLKILIQDYINIQTTTLISGEYAFSGKFHGKINWDPKGLFKEIQSINSTFPMEGLYMNSTDVFDPTVGEFSLRLKSDNIVIPRFFKLNGTTTTTCKVSVNSPKEYELLGLPQEFISESQIVVNQHVFVHFLPWWIDLLILLLLGWFIYFTHKSCIASEWLFKKKDMKLSMILNDEVLELNNSVIKTSTREVIIDNSFIRSTSTVIPDFTLKLCPRKPKTPFYLVPKRGTYIALKSDESFDAEITDFKNRTRGIFIYTEISASKKPLPSDLVSINLKHNNYINSTSNVFEIILSK